VILRALPAALLGLSLWSGPAPRLEEGLWPFDKVPPALAKARALDEGWLHHLRRAAVKLPGGSGAFVSGEGLVLTNHHVVRRWLQQASDATRDLVKDGFVAADRRAELPLPGLTLRTLESMVDVTAQVNRAVKRGMTPTQALHARRVAFAAVKQELQERTRLVCEQVSFHGGAQYWIYGYRRHDDVRLVLSAEQQVAFFGGLATNFAYPRHALDAALLRVYDQGQPLRPPHFLRLAVEPARPGDQAFVAGHPGRTQRRETLAQMHFSRDVALPWRLAELERRERVLRAFADRSPEHARQVRTMRTAIANGIQKFTAWLAYLNDPDVMADLAIQERQLKAAMGRRKDLARLRGSFRRIEHVLAHLERRYAEYQLLTTGDSLLLSQGLLLHRLAVEPAKASADRLPEFQDAYLPAQRDEVRADVPIHRELERHILTAQLDHLVRVLGERHPFVRTLLCGRTPEALATWATEGTRLHDRQARIQLLEGGPRAIQACNDPYLVLARRIDPLFRTKRAWVDEDINASLSEHLARLGRARFALEGGGLYPDANGTLRLSFGVLPTEAGAAAPTTFGDLAVLAGQEGEAWQLPSRWREALPRLSPRTPLNFVCRADVASGSSGSPVVNARGHLLGMVFDGNYACINGQFRYDTSDTQVICLDLRALLEALRVVYGAPHLAEELQAPPTGLQNTPKALAEALPRPRRIR